MQYFNSFESYALLLLQNENIRYTKYPISTHPAKENKSCMLRMPMLFKKKFRRNFIKGGVVLAENLAVLMRNGRELCALP